MPISTPTQITVPFATSGLKNAIPAASDPVNGKAGYDQGFTAINMTAKTAGGIPPFGQDFNGIFFDISTALQFLEAGGAFPYNSTFATAVGGYPLGALVSRTDGTGLWRNTVANNTTDPEAFGAGWQPESAGLSSIAMSNTNVTLTALQAARPIIVITGTLTANLNLIFPTYRNTWTVINNATGAFSVTCKTSAGSGVTVATGKTASLYGDGTNIGSAGASGALLNIQIFGASSTYTPTPGTKTIIAEVLGAGAGGGGVAATGAGNAAGGGGGSSGSWARTGIIANPGVQTVTVGAGGVGVAGGYGTAGGDTSFGAIIKAYGGQPGANGAPTSGGFVNAAGGLLAATPTGSYTVAFSGQRGSAGFQINSNSVVSGSGGNSVYGGGGAGAGQNGTAAVSGNGAGAGAGAGGGGAVGISSGAAVAGGAGNLGLCIVYEYA